MAQFWGIMSCAEESDEFELSGAPIVRRAAPPRRRAGPRNAISVAVPLLACFLVSDPSLNTAKPIQDQWAKMKLEPQFVFDSLPLAVVGVLCFMHARGACRSSCRCGDGRPPTSCAKTTAKGLLHRFRALCTARVSCSNTSASVGRRTERRCWGTHGATQSS